MKIVCELSGGADSVYATVLAKKRWPGAEITGIFFYYGQVCENQEFDRAFEAARKLGIKFKICRIGGIWEYVGMISGETDESTDVYTPLRNVAILGSVMAFADSIDADIIVTGSKSFCKVPEEEHSYYDSTLPFYKMMEAVWNYTTELKREVRIIPILAEGRNTKLSKKEVYKGLVKEGFGKKDTWSCFKGNQGNEECGNCYNCSIKKEIFEELDDATANSKIKE